MRNTGPACAAVVGTFPLAASAAAAASTLPVGAAKSFVFGSVKDGGSKVSLPPRNPRDVDQRRVAHAPKVGPFHIALSAGEKAWPSACRMTSAAQLHGLFPAITGVSGQRVTGGVATSVDQAVWVDQIEIPLAEKIGSELHFSG